MFEVLEPILICQYVLIAAIFLGDSYYKDKDKDLREFKTKKQFLLHLIPFYWIVAILIYLYKTGIKKMIENYKSLE